MADSIRKKVVVLAFAAGMFLGLAFTSASFTAWRCRSGNDCILYLASSQAKMIASNVTTSLSFYDDKDALDILNSLKNQGYIAFAGVYDNQGRLFACYYRNDVNQQDFVPPPPSKAKFKKHNGYFVVSEPVIVDHNFVGTVCLCAQP